ncbi:hypothetical protein MP228_010407 [Amoeboaphelidium protococcarum]|nr:hypothetical protein MP228_010407 [Amoeboaphelidium protococcarum]
MKFESMPQSMQNDVKQQLPGDALFIDGKYFKDGAGRVINLRGVNLSGSAKLPTYPMVASTTHGRPSQELDFGSMEASWFDHRSVSFVGRPFPLDEAYEHLTRLKNWGFNFMRFCITWEAIEHAGPGQFDEDYIAYLIQVLQIIKSIGGIKVFIDPHQDCWSRFTGGSGAPIWTLELVGFDLRVLTDDSVGCAIVHNTWKPRTGEDLEKYPKMIWPTNYQKLGCFTMFTLFFGGNQFLPRCFVLKSAADSNLDRMIILTPEQYIKYKNQSPFEYAYEQLEPVQDYLQRHYMESICHLIRRIRESAGDLLDSIVVGYDTLNEPSPGLIGHDTLKSIPKSIDLKSGCAPTFLQSMLVGQGLSIKVDYYKFGALGPRKAGKVVLNSKQLRVWKDGFQCPYEAHGVYDLATQSVIDDQYFFKVNGKVVDAVDQFWFPFTKAFIKQVRAEHQNAIIFFEPPVMENPPHWKKELDTLHHRLVFAPHWYDGITLMNKSFSKWWTVDYVGFKRNKYATILNSISLGFNGVKNNFAGQLRTITGDGVERLGEVPTLIGEIGIPFDMDNKNAYKRRRNETTQRASKLPLVQSFMDCWKPKNVYQKQRNALDANMFGLEKNLLNFTLWNYCSSNCHKWGDQWNGEDLSLWSKDDYFYDNAAEKLKRIDSQAQDADSAYVSLKSDDAQLGREHTSFQFAPISRGRERCATSPVKLPSEEHPSSELNKGARALDAFLRPYARKVCGIPTSQSFDSQSTEKSFRLQFVSQSTGDVSKTQQQTATEVFVPLHHYGVPIDFLVAQVAAHRKSPSFTPTQAQGNQFTVTSVDQLLALVEMDQPMFVVEVSSGSWSYCFQQQIVSFVHDGTVPHGNQAITIKRLSKRQAKQLVLSALNVF